MLVNTPFESHVPTDMKENLLWRARTHKKVMEDPSYASVLVDACAADPIFYINGFLYTYDPRLQPYCRVPFILYPFQRDGILETFEAIGNEDLLIEKSRDMGASWLAVVAFEYLWHFKTLLSFLVVSSKEEFVDKSGNPKTLFWKIDFIHKNLPSWLMPKGYKLGDHRTKLHMENPATGSVIDGESTTGEVARGDRRTAALFDEFAKVEQGHKVLSSTRDVTKSRLFNSTPAGINNAYYTLRQTDIRRLRFFWTEHPEKSKGLYRIVDGNLEVSDKENYPEGYSPLKQKWREKLDGQWRSPWFDNECQRAATWPEIAQEILIDYLGSGHQFFLEESIREAIKKFARPPVITGDLGYDILTGEPSKFREDKNGHLRLWVDPDREGNIAADNGRYIIGCDISAGTGSSNTTACIYDQKTNEKIGEYANPQIRPEAFALQVFALGTWLNSAFVIWESNGVGRQFGAKFMELNYNNVYFRIKEESIAKKHTLIPGWHSTKETKLVLLGEYAAAVQGQKIVNRSEEALLETLEYIHNGQGGVSHAKSDNTDDPTGARDNHGDRVIADALAWRGLTDRMVKPKAGKREVPIGSLAWRREQHKLKSKSRFELPRVDGW